MDKTLELVIAATVILMTAASVMFMMSDRSTKFSNWSNETTNDAQCSLDKAQYKNACDCDATNPETDKAAGIKDQADGCSWASGGSPYSCSDYC